MTTGALLTESDFRQVVVDYAAEAASHGAVYLEGIFSPSEPASRGVSYEEVFAGYCDGAQEACESHGGRGSVPHAGEADGPASVRGALEVLGADRIRHGIRATEDRGLLRELADRGTVLDVCPISNVRTGVVRSLAEHPLPELLAAGIQATINTDDPAMFGNDLSTEYATALRLGASATQCYAAGVKGALCDESSRAELRKIGAAFDWDAVRRPRRTGPPPARRRR